ncbi:histidine kinase [Actinomycetes bacterium KLBMP 9797]
MRVAKDLLLWTVFAVPVAIAWPGHHAYPFWLLIVGLTGLGAAVALSRRYPLASLFLVVAIIAIDGNYSFALPVVSYLVGRRMATIRPAAIAFAAIVVLASPYVLVRSDFLTWASQAGVLVYAGLFPWLVGRYRRQQLELVTAGWEHAEHLEREQRMVADQVRLRERTRIAEDMHDSLGHELSLIALRAGALEMAPDLPDHHRAGAAELRASAGVATERLREIIGVLRDSSPPTWPVGETIAELVRRARDSGMAVSLVGADGLARAGSLPPMVDRAAHRVVQEALTNANKHAPGAPVTVSLTTSTSTSTGAGAGAGPPTIGDASPSPAAGHATAGPSDADHAAAGTHGAGPTTAGTPGPGRETAGLPDADHAAAGTSDVGHAMAGESHSGGAGAGDVIVSVRNARPPAGPLPGTVRGGQGLPGLRERVRLTGGTLTAGPTEDGGFAVVARLPSSAAAVPAPAPAETGSADRRRLAQRRARLGLVTAIAVPGGIGAVLGAVAVGYYLYATTSSVLRPSAYASLTVGQDQAAVEQVLPRREMLDPPREAAPPGASCRYYRSHGEIFASQVDVYRLCFQNGKLVTKSTLPHT